ncbi:MAG: hypothetical protein EOM19_06030 [Candidatus Moranbacteria bacterium]|nr:hypothetical protein [Candidatus Moranbacteria bacterium]
MVWSGGGMSKKNERKEENVPDLDPSCMEIPSGYYHQMVPREYQKTHYIFFLEETAGKGISWVEDILFSRGRKKRSTGIKKKYIGGREYNGIEITDEELKIINSMPSMHTFVVQKKK